MENDKVIEIVLTMSEKMDKTLSVLKEDFAAIRAGRANPHILDKVSVNYYGTQTALSQTSNISVSDARCLVISPWDTSLLKEIEKALLAANIGITPTNDGKVIRLVFPELTEERRKEIAKNIRKMCEEAKIATRNIRRDALESLKRMKTAKELTEDEFALSEKDVEKHMSKITEAIDKVSAEKEKEIMSV